MEHLIYVGIVHTSFTAVFLGSKRDRTPNDTVLAAWMVFMALPMLSGLVAQEFPGISVPVLSSDLIYPLTYGPFLWLYVGTLTGDIDRLQRRDLLHFLPFIAVSLYQILSGWAPSMPTPEDDVFGIAERGVGAVNLLLLLGYAGAVARRLHLHGKEVVDHFSELPNRITLAWLRWIAAGVFGVFLLLFLGSAMAWPVLLSLHFIGLIGLILVLSFFGLRQTRVFARESDLVMGSDARQVEASCSGSASSPEPLDFPEPEPVAKREDEYDEIRAKGRYRRSGLTEERADVISTRLETFMREERPYLDAELTIERLAKRMAVPRHHLTQVISERHGKNFYLFVNEYRIQCVKQALKAPETQGATLLEVAYASGFNSKSTFNTAFKRLTGMTPSQYRRQMS